jgi:hypothetical protein
MDDEVLAVVLQRAAGIIVGALIGVQGDAAAIPLPEAVEVGAHAAIEVIDGLAIDDAHARVLGIRRRQSGERLPMG